MAASDTPAPPLRWGRILGMALAIFLTLEAAAQAYFVAWTGRPFGSVFLYQWSPYGLVRNNPRLTGNFIISPQGFREVRDYAKDKPPNTFRVLLMGGSVLYSGSTPVNRIGYVQSDKTISQYLERLLQADPAFKGVNVEVINAGVNYNRITEVSTAYLGEYIKWSPDVLIVFGSANNFMIPVTHGSWQDDATILQQNHDWEPEFQRLVNERSLASTIEAAFRQAADASAAMAILHKTLERNLIEAPPYLRFRIQPPGAPRPQHEPGTPAEELQYFNLYASYADAIVAAARRADTDVAFVWEWRLGDLGGLKPMSPDERRIYASAKRTPDQIAYDQRAFAWWKQLLAGDHVPIVDPLHAITSTPSTVYNDYLHYTANGNAVVAQAVYDQLQGELARKLASERAGGPAPGQLPAVATNAASPGA